MDFTRAGTAGNAIAHAPFQRMSMFVCYEGHCTPRRMKITHPGDAEALQVRVGSQMDIAAEHSGADKGNLNDWSLRHGLMVLN